MPLRGVIFARVCFPARNSGRQVPTRRNTWLWHRTRPQRAGPPRTPRAPGSGNPAEVHAPGCPVGPTPARPGARRPLGKLLGRCGVGYSTPAEVAGQSPVAPVSGASEVWWVTWEGGRVSSGTGSGTDHRGASERRGRGPRPPAAAVAQDPAAPALARPSSSVRTITARSSCVNGFARNGAPGSSSPP
jgi:hypothetical protein